MALFNLALNSLPKNGAGILSSPWVRTTHSLVAVWLHLDIWSSLWTSSVPWNATTWTSRALPWICRLFKALKEGPCLHRHSGISRLWLSHHICSVGYNSSAVSETPPSQSSAGITAYHSCCHREAKSFCNPHSLVWPVSFLLQRGRSTIHRYAALYNIWRCIILQIPRPNVPQAPISHNVYVP